MRILYICISPYEKNNFVIIKIYQFDVDRTSASRFPRSAIYAVRNSSTTMKMRMLPETIHLSHHPDGFVICFHILGGDSIIKPILLTLEREFNKKPHLS